MRIYQSYNTNDDDDRDGFTANWMSQTFTPEINHIIGSVKLKLFRVGDPETITISIKATSGGKPVGADLCSGEIEGMDLTDNANGEFYEISLGDGFNLNAGIQYAIVVRAPDGDASNKVSWRADITSPTYTRGVFVSSSDSGVDWSIVSGVDCMFEEWGVGQASPTTVVWGNLFKSQLSAEKIEDAILRLIQDHEDDPDAHIETGESLQSHKASEIIDHLAASIIADKIKEWEVIKVGGSFDRNDFHWYCLFESLAGLLADTYEAATISLDYNQVEISTGATQYGYGLLWKNVEISNVFSWDENRRLRTRIYFDNNTDQLLYFAIGNTQNITDTKYIGFKIVNGDIYAGLCDGSSETLVDTTINITAETSHDFEVVWEAGVSAKFYVDGVLRATISTDLPSGAIDADVLMTLFFQTMVATEKIIRFSFWDFWQDIT